MVKTSIEYNSITNPVSLQIPTLQLNFNIPLRPNQIPLWRGAVIQSAGKDKKAFHNHQEGDKKYHYRYPLIQYRTWQGKAAIFGIGKGSQLLRHWILEAPPAVEIGRRLMPLGLYKINDQIQTVALGSEWSTYYLHHYLPFNQENYRLWQQKEDLKAGLTLIESILVGHLLSFASGIDWEIPEHIDVKVIEIQKTEKFILHQVPRIGFNLSFKTNLQLPTNIGLGKGVSHGFGVLRPFRKE